MKTKFWNLLPQWFKNIPHSDKYAHAILGTLIFVIIACLFLLRPQLVGWSDRTIFACLITFGIGFINEVVDDKKKKGSGSLFDLLATIIIPVLLTLAAHIMENGK